MQRAEAAGPGRQLAVADGGGREGGIGVVDAHGAPRDRSFVGDAHMKVNDVGRYVHWVCSTTHRVPNPEP
jgi:hypothetical protein